MPDRKMAKWRTEKCKGISYFLFLSTFFRPPFFCPVSVWKLLKYFYLTSTRRSRQRRSRIIAIAIVAATNHNSSGSLPTARSLTPTGSGKG